MVVRYGGAPSDARDPSRGVCWWLAATPALAVRQPAAVAVDTLVSPVEKKKADSS